MKSSVLDAGTTGPSTNTSALLHAWRAERNIDDTAWGLNPVGYHLTSALFHAANALLVYRLAAALLTAADRGTSTWWDIRRGAMAAALVFALNPQRVESVAWATERRDVTMGLFALLTVLAYLRAVRESADGRLDRRWYWA